MQQLLLAAFLLIARPLCSGSSLSGGPYDYGFDARSDFQKRQGLQPPIVTGIPVTDGPVPFRREIRELEADEDAWNLYLLALSWMEYTDQSDPFSYYQIAGIHGTPGQTWGGVSPLPDRNGIGYCQHVSIIFPTWHRPYLALYEQTLFGIVQHIVSLYAPIERERLQGAADSFRIPYLDWAIAPPDGTSVLPLSVGTPQVNVSGPNGIQTIDNPLFSYMFRPFNGSIFPGNPWSQWNETKRAPQPEAALNAVSNNSAVALSLDIHLQTHQQRLYNLFANYGNYFNFSNEGWIPGDKLSSFDSIESLHDSFHLIAGGRVGHLAIIPFSAFDPLFFLHHATCDRIFAMWQLIYNESYVSPAPAIYSSHTTSAGDIQDANSPLTPFYFNDTAFWTSQMVRDHEVFGYTYADVVNRSRDEVIGTINTIYTDYSPATPLGRRLESFHHVQFKGISPSKSGSSNSQKLHHLPMKSIFEAENVYREWVANVRVKKGAMNGSFYIHLFLGRAPEDPFSWLSSSNLVGTLGVFSHPGGHKPMADRHIAGTIPLTSALMDMLAAGHLRNLRPKQVAPFLKSNLDVTVSSLDGTVVNALEVDGLGISIVSSRVKVSTKNRLAAWGEFESHFDLWM